MKNVLLALSVLAFSAVASAADMGLEVGFRSQSGDGPAGTSAKSETGYQVGIVTAFPLNGALNLRLGYLYTQRPLSVTDDVTGATSKANLNYFDIPVTLLYKFEEYAGIFAGPVVAINLDNSCSGVAGCKINDVKSPVVPIQLGATFKFAPQLGATVYFETSGGDMATGLSNYRAVGANLLVTFD